MKKKTINFMKKFTGYTSIELAKTRLWGLRRQLTCLLIPLFFSACSEKELPEGFEGYVKEFYGGVAGDEPRSVLEARKILTAGGSAADAATALYFALAVTLPSSASLGGGGSCLVFRPKLQNPGWGKPIFTQKIEALEFFTRSPSVIFSTTSRPSAVPGNIAGMFALHARYGRMSWSKLVVVGEKLARFGIQASRALLSDLEPVEGALNQDPVSNLIFHGPKGNPIKEGDYFQQIDLANTLSKIRMNGPIDFYRGKFAEFFVDRVNAAGGALSLEDLQNYRPRWVKPVSMEIGTSYFNKNKAYFVPPPAAAGIVEAQILGILDREGSLNDASSKAKYHFLAEASLIAYVQRGRWMQEDLMSKFPEKDLVSKSGLDRLLGKFSDKQHRPSLSFKPNPSPMPENTSATSFVVIDNQGMSVSCAFTMNNLFGIGRIARDTGIMIAATPEGIGRGSISLGPMMIINPFNDQFVLAASASGGATGASAISSVVARSYLGKQSLKAAIAAPRVHHGGAPDVTYFEPNLGKDVVSYLVNLGHNVAATPRIGLVNIAYCSGGLPGGPETCSIRTDPRGYGLALNAAKLAN